MTFLHSRLLATAALALGGAFLATLGGCATEPQSFASPDEAVNALIAALRTDSQADLERILGSDSKELLASGDSIADDNAREEFLRLYDQKHRLVAVEGAGETEKVLEVGNNDWPLPIPVAKDEQGWFFDTITGLDEMLSRRIGRNELATIQVCLAVADAQREYAAADYDRDGWNDYAQKFISDPGQKNGLYWPSAAGEPESPLGELVAGATAEGYGASGRGSGGKVPFHGYLYRLLTAQGPAAPGGEMQYLAKGHLIGGFAVVAYPADYGNSGLKTFLVSHHGVVYEKDLGDNTDRAARNMKSFNPDSTWTRSDTTPPPAGS